jgi:Carbohydrate-binding module 48 (Isoamylase N-terminal domain)
MDLSTVARRIGKLEFAAVRLPFGLLEECVIARSWDEDAPIRAAFEYFLGSLDEFAGRLLDDEEICRRGQALKRETGFPPPGPAGPGAPSPWAEAAAGAGAPPEPPDAGADAEAPPEPPDAGADAEAPPEPPEPPEPPDAGAREPAARPPDVALTPTAPPGTVDVVFTLPADVGADRVALCGDFNDWSPDAIGCARATDGTWQVTVALEPGRSYRYRYLLDGERWENGGQADRYEPNPYGGVDSVVVVE